MVEVAKTVLTNENKTGVLAAYANEYRRARQGWIKNV
jgi:hypothetical protein